MRPFDRTIIKPGDALFLRLDPSAELRYRRMAHTGDVVATWVKVPPGRGKEAVLRPKDVLMADEPVEVDYSDYVGWGGF